MPWVRYTNQPSLTYSNLTGFFGTVVYKVWNVDREVIMSRPGDVKKNPGSSDADAMEPLPDFDSEWPGLVSDGDVGSIVRLDEYQVTKNGSELIVTGIYTDRRSRNAFASSFQTTADEVKYQVKVPISVPVPGVPSQNRDPQWGWLDLSIPAWSTITRFTIIKYVNVQFENQQQVVNTARHVDFFSEIKTQTNKLHDFAATDANGNTNQMPHAWFRFEGGDARQIAWDRFEVSYSWIHDSGILCKPDQLFIPQGLQGIDPAAFRGNISFPALLSSLDPAPDPDMPIDTSRPVYFRAPFEQTLMMPDARFFDPVNIGSPEFLMRPPPQTFVSRALYDSTVPHGWALLPGMTAP